ncbi:MAG: DNA repair protein RadC [Lachnospiraceae bacterium]|nr:DNA repair protein RadC [Lachnospiraceae bacterium]
MNKTEKRKSTCKENLPYEKYLRFGPEALTESELLAIILRTGTKDRSAVEIAEEILSLSDSPRTGLLGIYDIPLERLMQVKGLGQVKAVKIKCITELAMRINSASAKDGLIVKKPATVANYFMEKLRHRRKECVIIACLDGKGQIIREVLLSSGSVNMSLISPREVFLEALRCEAVSIILVHNHPSGDPTPSSSDAAITKCIKEMGDKLDVPLLDHIIIGDNCYTSFKEQQFI